MRARKVKTDSAGYWKGFQWDRTEGVCVFRPPLSMKANQLGWKRHVLREDSQSTNPNELQLEIRRRRGRTMNTFWMRMKGKDGEKKKGSPVGQIQPAIDSNTKAKRETKEIKETERLEGDGKRRG